MSDPALEQLWQACGAPGPLALEVECAGHAEPVHGSWPHPFGVIGRDANADLVIEDAAVARRQVYVQMVGGRLFWVKLRGSQDEPRFGDFGPGQPIELPPLTIRPCDATPPSSWSLPEGFHPLTARVSEPDPLPAVTLQFLHGSPETTSWPMKRMLTLVGHSHLCKVKLIDARVSSIHCSLLRLPQGVWLIDLLGRDGVKVNGKSVRWARLDDGDIVQIARFVIRCEIQAPVLSASPPLPAVAPRWPVSTAAFSTSPVPAEVPVQVLPPGTTDALLPLFNQFANMQQHMFDQFQQTVLMMAQMFTSMQKEQMGLIRHELDRIQELTRELQDLQVRAAKSPPEPSPIAPVIAPTPAEAAPVNGTESKPPPVTEAPARVSDRQPAPVSEGASNPQDVHLWLQQRIAALQNERETRLKRVVKQLFGK